MAAPSPRASGPTESRAAALRRHDRRVFGWSFGIAALAHVLVLFFGPWFRTEPPARAGTELVEGASVGSGGIPFEVLFGPPTIVDETGSPSTEPPDRVLTASRLVPAPFACTSRDWLAREMTVGEVRLTVDRRGRVAAVELTRSTGDRCWDAVTTGLASDLWYRWLPSQRFPAPVVLYQPVTLSLTDYE